MKRLVSVLIMFAALAGVGAMMASAQAPSRDLTGRPIVRQGNFGKIIAIKPLGDWQRSRGPADTHSIFKPLVPFNLPVFGVDVNIGPSNETFIASDPLNPLYFIAGSNA